MTTYPVRSETWNVAAAGPYSHVRYDERYFLMLATGEGSGILRAEFVTGPDQLASFVDRAARYHQRTPTLLCCDRGLLRYLAHWSEQPDCDIRVFDPYLHFERAIIERQLIVLLRHVIRECATRGFRQDNLRALNEALACVLNVDYDRYFAAVAGPSAPAVPSSPGGRGSVRTPVPGRQEVSPHA